MPETASDEVSHDVRERQDAHSQQHFNGAQNASCDDTGVNAARDAGDTSPPIFWLAGTSMGISPPILLRTFEYSRPILVVLTQWQHSNPTDGAHDKEKL